MLKHDLNLLNNTRFCYNPNTKECILWIYHDKNYKNGTFYLFNYKTEKLFLITVRNCEYIEQEIQLKEEKL